MRSYRMVTRKVVRTYVCMIVVGFGAVVLGVAEIVAAGKSSTALATGETGRSAHQGFGGTPGTARAIPDCAAGDDVPWLSERMAREAWKITRRYGNGD
jgi:hypothetical protein